MLRHISEHAHNHSLSYPRGRLGKAEKVCDESIEYAF